ncbi:hypothetical protein HRM2_21970 [Desulforapulum autotrophicum HRM2]|uniref:Uncharacterized protein n=1 Tax=Desulforapulum autotrophicum (strain ATCC 43914 / DSM 3382 / VKM B-1955 / HRM2) TaxID=177437 RepID=C0QDN1_DESAH|nr:hypothetical protein [Desulforapulum autotrophicum]ACN15295.1 hypothetical protein HRM2_21970 [Desulforapulum autotrophicum HRM2]
MARKITLSIPDLLHEKMEEWRQSFNLSKMFQDALAEAILKKEEFQRRFQEDTSMSETIERLRREKRVSEGNFLENGRIEGFQWAKSAHYDDLMYALALESVTALANDERLAPCFAPISERDQLTDKHVRLFIQGWQRGITEFWNEIKEKL